MSPVAAGFAGSQIGTDEANERNEDELHPEEPSSTGEPSTVEGTEPGTEDSSPPEGPSDESAVVPPEGSAPAEEEHADVQLEGQGDDSAPSGVREAGSVELGA
jgi:hypothetical protein